MPTGVNLFSCGRTIWQGEEGAESGMAEKALLWRNRGCSQRKLDRQREAKTHHILQ